MKLGIIGSEKNRFYLERDRRSVEYLGVDDIPPSLISVSIHADDEACLTQSGQLLLVTLANQLARVHRSVYFSLAAPNAALMIPSVCKGTSIGEEILVIQKRIDPYGTFDVAGLNMEPAEISIGVGMCRHRSLSWYLGYDRFKAELAEIPRPLGQGDSSDLRGAGLSAILGASAAIKTALQIETVPVTLSAWDFAGGQNADRGPADLPKIDVGRVLMIGGGAVATNVVYWLMQFGITGSWTIVDGDIVKLHNTNRCLLFFPDDAGWTGQEPKSKVACLSQYMINATPIPKWYDEAPQDVWKQQYDTVLVLANDRNVRTIVSHRNDPIQFQATTGRSWLSQLHRHISGRDDCVRCRMSDIGTPILACSEAQAATTTQPDRSDAALPFLSAASGLMLVSALQHLQLSEFGENSTNTWRWDFRSTHQIASSSHHVCRKECSMQLPPDVRREIAENTCWRDQSWLAPKGSTVM